ncbi:cob(I)yrinic acid a,c-diamide adenosyltransferase [Spirosoma daeguense]
MKIYTKTGDKGQTALIGGRRVSKSDARIDAYGTVDELNAWIGLLRDQPVNIGRKEVLVDIQDRLFTIGAELATDPEKTTTSTGSRRPTPMLESADITALEVAIDTMEAQLQPLRAFILPGGHESVSYCHVARTVCRRTERLVTSLHEHTPIDEQILQYLNRLSDYLFVLGRLMAQELNADEIVWRPRM